jgi:hypothetical protein
VNGKGLGRGSADGVPSQHLAVRKQRYMNADHGPVGDWAHCPTCPGSAATTASAACDAQADRSLVPLFSAASLAALWTTESSA